MATNLSVTLAWDASPGVSVHRVHYGTQGGTYPSVTPATTSDTATVGNLSPGTTYHFVATALDAAGRESGPSNPVSYAVPGGEPAPTPTPDPTPPPTPVPEPEPEPVPNAASSLFAADSVPALMRGRDRAIELGVVFRASRPGKVVALRFYKNPVSTAQHTGHLWDYSGRPLASVTFTHETEKGWQQANLPEPIPIAAHTRYVASCHSWGHYAQDVHYFDAARASGALETPANAGVYSYGPSGTFPRRTYRSSNYWVDVVFVG